MLYPRIIPCLLVHNNGLVKTVNFRQPKYVGDPLNAVKIFNEKEVDEIIVLDIDATRYGKEPNFKMIEDLAGECRMPLCYGGGVKTPEQAERIIDLGVEKVAISSVAVENKGIINEIASRVGRQSVVVVLDVKKKFWGSHYEIYVKNATVNTGIDPIEFAIEMQQRGAGELVINSIDNDGVMKGYDLEIIKKIRKAVNIPITTLGGAGSLDDIGSLIREHGIIGAAAGSLFVFKGKFRAVLINYPPPQEKEQLIRTNLEQFFQKNSE